MKKYLITFYILSIFSVASFAQQPSSWDNWQWLLGEWNGEGTGKPGEGNGTFSFTFDLDKKILVRKSLTKFPATDLKPASIHEDLMIIYLDFSGNPSKAIYFDNESHTIQYSIQYSDKTITFLSEKIPNVPVFKLSYSWLSDNTINTKFELSQDGQNFMTYIEGKSSKIKK